MALIVKCRKCRRRVPQDATSCPACGSTAFRFIVDHYPAGRRGGRKQITLPEGTTLEGAIDMEGWMTAIKHKPLSATSPGSTVADLFPSYLDWYKIHRAPTSYTDIKYAWRRFDPILGRYQVREIAPEHFSLYQQLRKPTEKNRAANKDLDYFKGFLRWCRREKKIEVQKIEYEPLPYKRPLPVVLSPGEVSAFMKAAEVEPLWHAFFLCLYCLGFRLNEARNLKPGDFDFQNRAVKVRQKGGAEKILPLNKQVTAAVKRLVKVRACKPDDYLFVSRNGQGKPVRNVRVAIARICGRAGIEKRVTPHTFRHSVATNLMGNNVNASIIQKFLGHANLATTQWYSHVSMENLRAAQGMVSTNKRMKSP